MKQQQWGLTTKGQLCASLDCPLPHFSFSFLLFMLADQGSGSPVTTVSLDTHHWLSIRASMSCDPKHRAFKELLTDSVISTWLLILFEDYVISKHPQTKERLWWGWDKWPHCQGGLASSHYMHYPVGMAELHYVFKIVEYNYWQSNMSHQCFTKTQ